MKVVLVLVLLSGSICFSTARFIPKDWTSRLNKYKSIAACNYYITSETEYRDYIPILSTDSTTNEPVKSIKFFTLSSQPFRFKLTLKYEFAHVQSPDEQNPDDQYLIVEPSTEPMPLTSSEFRQYEVALRSDGYSSSVKFNDGIIKRLYTPNLFYDNEPNEIVIELDDGLAQVVINNQTQLQFESNQGSSFQSISFASGQNDQRREFFYNFN